MEYDNQVYYALQYIKEYMEENHDIASIDNKLVYAWIERQIKAMDNELHKQSTEGKKTNVQEYYESIADKSIEVIKELPKGVYSESNKDNVTEVVNLDTGQGYVYCKMCDGYIPGRVGFEFVNDMDSMKLAGRRGTRRFCKRCTYEFSFKGSVS